MGTSDGTVLGTTKIIDNGPAPSRWNLVILGDGYQASEMTKYHNDVQNFVNTLFATAPFDQLGSGINIYRVDVTSTDSGADDPSTCRDGSTGSGATPRTYFDASFCNNGIRRLLEVNNSTALTVAAAQVPQVLMTMVIVNTTIYGGSGGSVATFSLAPNSAEIGIHEMGHTGFGLADEYEYYTGCDSKETGRDTYTGGEPTQPNVTKDTNRATNKWRSLIQATTAMPTTTNADCTKCDPQPSPVPAGTVGTFEGAYCFHCGCYRPEFNCCMRALGNPFCAVCQQVIRQALIPYLPIDGLVFYEPRTRTGAFYSTDGQGGISLLRRYTSWRKGWSLIVPGNFGGNGYTDLLFYEPSTGTGAFYSTDGQGGIPARAAHWLAQRLELDRAR